MSQVSLVPLWGFLEEQYTVLTSISFARSKCFVFVVCMRYERPECVKTTQRMLGATFPCCFSLHSFFYFVFLSCFLSLVVLARRKKKKKSRLLFNDAVLRFWSCVSRCSIFCLLAFHRIFFPGCWYAWEWGFFFFIYEYIDSSDSSHKLNTQFLGWVPKPRR